jgi:predicted MPP superfamily phosphohydrolase
MKTKPKFFRVMSDLHLDFDAYYVSRNKKIHEAIWYPPELPEDPQTVLVIAGDMWSNNQFFKRVAGETNSWIEKISKRFHSVVCIFGNHDYWGMNINNAIEKANLALDVLGLLNVYILEDSSVILGDMKFIGATLWTDYKGGDPLVMFDAPKVMGDYKRITFEQDGVYSKLRVSNILNIHQKSLTFILENTKRDYPEQKVIVVSHMAPSINSVNEMYYGDKNNYFYYSALDKYFYEEEFQCDFWIHGHMHSVSDYEIGRTRVICNPRGYVTEMEHGFNELLRFSC